MILEVAVVVFSLAEVGALVYIAKQGRGIRDKMDADDAALYLQGRRIEDVLREMRGEQLGADSRHPPLQEARAFR